jgi:hypothetical protein
MEISVRKLQVVAVRHPLEVENTPVLPSHENYPPS